MRESTNCQSDKDKSAIGCRDVQGDQTINNHKTPASSSTGTSILKQLKERVQDLGIGVSMRDETIDELTLRGEGEYSEVTATVPRLNNLEIQDTRAWIKEVEDGFERCQIEEVRRVPIIRLLVANHIREMLPMIDSAGIMKYILRLQYNQDRFNTILGELNSNRLESDETIRAYYKRTTSLFDVANLCVDEENGLTEFDTNSYLIKGLPKWMRKEVMKDHRRKWNEILQILEKAESEKCERKNMAMVGFEGCESSDSVYYCTYHNSRAHSTEECKALRRAAKLEGIVRTPLGITEYSMLPEMKIIVGSETLVALLSTGECLTLVSQDAVRRFGLFTEILDDPIEIKHPNGMKEILSTDVSLSFEIPQIPGTIYKVHAAVARHPSYDVILGMNFLKRTGARFDYKNGYVIVDGKMVIRLAPGDFNHETGEKNPSELPSSGSLLKQKSRCVNNCESR